jgi:DNA-binding transcriptional LysR family regulator
MEMRRLEVFCKVVELRSFTKAAEALLLSQPTVSEHIRTLEETLGEKMLDRLGREIGPTPAGEVFYRYAVEILRMREEALQALARFKGEVAGRIVLGASTIPGTYFLPKLVGAFKTEHPSVSITLRIGDTAEITTQVLDGDIEAGVIGSLRSDRRLITEEIFSDELVLAVYPDHPFAGTDAVDPEDLYGQPFILRERGSGTRAVMMGILEDHGLEASRLSVVAEMGSTEAVRQGIKAKIGISVLSRAAVIDDTLHGELRITTINNVTFSRPLYLVRRKNRQTSPVCLAFLDYIRAGGERTPRHDPTQR